MNVDMSSDAPEEVQKAALNTEIGTSGLKQSAGYVREEFLPQLTGYRAITTYQEMSDNDPSVGSVIFAIDKLLRNVKWNAEGEDDEIVDFLNECMNDMTLTWADFISEIMSMATYGWSYFEIVYKRRNGPVIQTAAKAEQQVGMGAARKVGTRKHSRHNDGRIGWHKISLRAQSSLARWMFDENGGIMGMYQRAWPDFQEVFIPIEKGLLFRTTLRNNNPEGRSILRNSYRPWYYKKRIEEIEAVGIERDLAGFPVVYVDPEIMKPQADGSEHPHLAMYKEVVRNIRRDAQEGALFPSVFDQNGNQLVKLELLASGGSRQFDTTGIIDRYKLEILMSMLADFVMLGHEATGSFALSADKTDIFAVALGAWLQSIASTINNYAVPRLLRLNGMDTETDVKIVPSDIEEMPLADIVNVLTAVNALGGPVFPNRELQERLYKRMGLPMQTEDEEDDDAENQEVNRRIAERQEELTRQSTQDDDPDDTGV